jgi:hypothetical protein
MGGGGVVKLSLVWAMLDHCIGATNYTRRESAHHWRVTRTSDGRLFPRLPLGPHGKRTDPEIEKGHVRKMARFFLIEDCAENYFAAN